MNGESHTWLGVRKWDSCFTETKVERNWESTCHVHWGDNDRYFWAALKNWGPATIILSFPCDDRYPCADSLSFHPLLTSSLNSIRFSVYVILFLGILSCWRMEGETYCLQYKIFKNHTSPQIKKLNHAKLFLNLFKDKLIRKSNLQKQPDFNIVIF